MRSQVFAQTGPGDRSTPAGSVGPYLLGAALVAFALACALSRNFWQPVPDGLPARTAWLYISSSLVAMGGLGLMFAPTRRHAGLLLSVVFVALAACYLPRVIHYGHLIGAWLGFAEHLAIAVGAAAVWLRQGSERPSNAVTLAMRLMYSALAIVFGLSHVLSLPETVALVPAWLPGSGEFWAVATAIGHFGVALALIVNRQVVSACRVGAILYAVMGLMVWVPKAARSPNEWILWGCIAISLVLAGALWSLGEFLSDRRDGHHDAV